MVHQIKGCSEFFTSQARLLPEAVVQGNMLAMATSIRSQLQTMSTLDASQAAVMNTAIMSSSFSDSHKALLAEAVSAKAMMGVGTTSTAKTQTMTSVLNFFTGSDWAVFGDQGYHVSQKVGRVVERLHKLGLLHPSESTVKGLVAMLASAHNPGSDQSSLYGIVRDLKSALVATRANSDGPAAHRLSTYPESPLGLPKKHFDDAYPLPEDPPVSKNVDTFVVLRGRVPVRVTNKALKPHAAPSQTDPSQWTPATMQAMFAQAFQHTRHGQQDVPITYMNAGGTAPGRLAIMPRTIDVGTPPRSLSNLAIGDGSPVSSPVHASPCGQTSTQPSTKASVLESPGVLADDTHIEPGGDVAAAAGDRVRFLEKLVAGAAPATAIGAKTADGDAGKVIMKKPAVVKRPASAVAHVELDGLKLGCGKCRGSPGGCTQCRNPMFTGRRYQR